MRCSMTRSCSEARSFPFINRSAITLPRACQNLIRFHWFVQAIGEQSEMLRVNLAHRGDEASFGRDRGNIADHGIDEVRGAIVSRIGCLIFSLTRFQFSKPRKRLGNR